MPNVIPPEGRVVCMLSEIMNERQLSTIQVARLANLSRPTVRNLRDNRANSVRMTTVSKLCSALQVGVGVLFRHFTLHEWKMLLIENDLEEDQTLMGTDES